MVKSVFSRELFMMANYIIVNGECKKFRDINPEEFTSDKLKEILHNHDNVIIVRDDNVEIYCDRDFERVFYRELKKQVHAARKENSTNAKLYEKFVTGKLEMFVKHDNKLILELLENM